jgi:hypothetical protein
MVKIHQFFVGLAQSLADKGYQGHTENLFSQPVARWRRLTPLPLPALSYLGAIFRPQQSSPERIIGVYKHCGAVILADWASFVSPLKDAALKIVYAGETRLS